MSVCRSDDASNLGKTGIFWFLVSLLPVPNHRHHIPPHDQPTTPSTKYYTGRAAAGEIVIKRTQKKNESVLHERSESPCFRYFAVVIVRKRLLFGIPLTSSKKPLIAWPLFHPRQKERERETSDQTKPPQDFFQWNIRCNRNSQSPTNPPSLKETFGLLTLLFVYSKKRAP